MTRSIVAAFTLVALAAAPAAGQSMPRGADGKPDLSGIWHVVNSAAWNILPHHAEPDVPAGLGVVEGDDIPYRPEAAARQRENHAKRAQLDPLNKCYLPGVPRATYLGLPFQIVQTPNQITVLYEYAHAVRNVFMNSPHPKGPIEWWMGDSRGRWEGDTLVVDVVHFNDQTWFDRAGNHHSEQLHVVERYTPVDRDHLQYEVTIDDPKVFTRSWKMSMPLYRRIERNMQLLEYECAAFDEAFRARTAEPR
ncbi:MAG: hypothetical protein A3I61_14795 [Acidobacteria bacterium RIFCSPLOWO2_02_FULL_68_18]|nr:MAG: hypothetical protein A3I61_14795 [Acidobacteria bacterium RIFCSPLOWO2_02_FULL_68_18]OFW50908.1 MAG: hypothetical protein A3G77_14855 [Acidobacteria bacterium RIFCSPLOWO2_12_FULL_68_19]